MEYRLMDPEEISRIGEVNREELIEAEYVPKPDGSGFGITTRLVPLDPPLHNPAWGAEGTEHRIRGWTPALEAGGCMFGAFESGRLAGFGILGPIRRDRSAEVVALFVDRGFRRRGVGAELMRMIENEARQRGVDALYLFSNPTVSSVSFYLKIGYEITGLISKHIVKSLPGDVFMAKRITSESGAMNW